MVKTTIFNWFSQMHPGDQFFLVISTNWLSQPIHGIKIQKICEPYITEHLYMEFNKKIYQYNIIRQLNKLELPVPV